MVDLKQLTNYSITNEPTVFRLNDFGDTAEYALIELSGSVSKIGYNCSTRGNDYPIFLTMSDGIEKEFKISDLGIFEVQPLEFKDANDNDAETKIIQVYITKVALPKNIDFVFDYTSIV